MHFTCIIPVLMLLASAKLGCATENVTEEMDAMNAMNATEETLIIPSFHGYGMSNTHDFLHQLAGNYSDLADLYSIGNTTDGRPILVLSVYDKSSSMASADMEQVALIGAVHGNEPVTREILLQFAHDLLSNAADSHAELLSKATIHIMPELNLDGARMAFEHYDMGPECDGLVGRNNSDGHDISMSFMGIKVPMDSVEGSDDVTMGMVTGADGGNEEGAQGAEGPEQMIDRDLQEIIVFREWLEEKRFKLAATFYTGDGLYVEYPHFSLSEGREDEWTVLTHISQTYAEAHPDMSTGTDECPNGEGSTNGLKSMPFENNTMMVNYMYRNQDIFAIDVHLGCCNYDSIYDIHQMWMDNRHSLKMFCNLVLDESNFVKQEGIGTDDYGSVPSASSTSAPATTTTAASPAPPVIGPGTSTSKTTTKAKETTKAATTKAKDDDGPENIKSDEKPKRRSSKSSKKLSNGAIAGIVVGSVLVVGGGAAAIVATGATAGAAASAGTGASAGAASSAATSSGAGGTSGATSAAEAAEAANAAETSAQNPQQNSTNADVENPSTEQNQQADNSEPSDLDDSDGRTSPV